jgi:hypothetical protein
MSECEFCVDEDNRDCESCKLPEFTDDYYRDTCDVCHEFMMMPYSTRDHFNLVVCKKCAKKQAKEVYDEFSNDPVGKAIIGDFEGVYVESTGKWW